MYCIKCGQQNPDDSKFCINCGAELVGDDGANDNYNIQSENDIEIEKEKGSEKIDESDYPWLHCPCCKSTKIQAVSHTEVKGGYRAGRGCLGWLLFGPIGVLCGAFGKKSRITSTSTVRFVCMECGKEFENVDFLIEECERKMKLDVTIAIIVILAELWVCIDQGIPSFGDIIMYAIWPLAMWAAYDYNKKRRDDLDLNGYDSKRFFEKDK